VWATQSGGGGTPASPGACGGDAELGVGIVRGVAAAIASDRRRSGGRGRRWTEAHGDATGGNRC
jgi:hypothetical protein